jgi:hypothetical protein
MRTVVPPYHQVAGDPGAAVLQYHQLARSLEALVWPNYKAAVNLGALIPSCHQSAGDPKATVFFFQQIT